MLHYTDSEIVYNPLLDSPSYGKPVLPENYKDGEYFSVLDDAWDAFPEELYIKRNYDYKFGDSTLKYPNLVKNFIELGGSGSEFLLKQYQLILDIYENYGLERVYIVHSITPYLIQQLSLISQDMDNGVIQKEDLEDLPSLTWERYKAGGIALDEDFGGVYLVGQTDLNKNLLSALKVWVKRFQERLQVRENSLQGLINCVDNDFQDLDDLFYEKTGCSIDKRDSLLKKTHGFLKGISIVIPYYKAKESIFNLLLALNAQDLNPEEYKMVEVIIVDDGSDDCLKQDLKDKKYKFCLNVITLERNIGRAAARNRGADVAQHNTLLFIDADIILDKNAVREHAVRNEVIPHHLYTSLIQNIDFLEDTILRNLTNGTGIEPNIIYDEYRISEFVQKEQQGLYPLADDMLIHPLQTTENFRKMGYGKRLACYDLPCMVATYILSLTKDLFNRIGGFEEKFTGWGLEDTYFGAVGIALGAKVIPVLSSGGLHVAHAPHSGSVEEKRKEFQRNIELYKSLIK